MEKKGEQGGMALLFFVGAQTRYGMRVIEPTAVSGCIDKRL